MPGSASAPCRWSGSAVYPEMNRRAERMFTIEDRILDCFKRSET